jgi:hypothetical protein
MLARPKIPLKTPWIRPLSAGGKISERTVKTVAVSTPPARPCRLLKMISWVMSWLTPHSAEVSTNAAALPIRKIFRPYRSDSLPEIGTTAVLVSR